jgi:hypothetical protein
MEAQLTNETVVAPDTTEKKPLLKRIPKWALYVLGVVIVAGLGYYGYTQQWFKAITDSNPAKELLGTSEQQPAPAQVAAAPTSGDPMIDARSAFARGDINGAVTSYRAQLQRNPDDLNALGELANVYYAVGMVPYASQAYFELANKAIAQNRGDIAENLMPVLMQTNPFLASEVQNRLFDQQMQQPYGFENERS